MKTMAMIVTAAGMSFLGVTARAQVRLQGGGATFPAPIYQTWISEYQKIHPDAKIDYQAIGSGGGINGIIDKTFDFAGSDAPMGKKEIAKAGGPRALVEIPTVAGAVVLAYNLPELQGTLKLDGPTISEIYLGGIKSWNDPKIAALNPGAALPNMPITPVHRTDGSGTNFIFSNYLCTQSQEFNNKVGSGKSVEWPGGAGGPGNAGVTQVVQTTKGSLGYIELAYALQNKISFADLKNKDGKFVKATPESVAVAGEDAAANMKGTILAANIWNQAGENAYPISAFTYIIVYKDLDYLKDAARATALAEFLHWATSDGEKLAAGLDYAPLTESIQKKVAAALGELTWNGKPVTLSQ